jgi:ribulose-phosphate 3-epimerase
MVNFVLVMSVNPGFGGQQFLPLAVEKIAYLAALRKEMGLNFRIEVDGGVALDTVASVVQAGAELLVAGSAVFEKGRTEQNAAELLRVARAAAPAG